MTIITPISAETNIAAKKLKWLKAASSAANNFMQASKNENFNLREYAKKGLYYMSGAKLEGKILGETGASLKLLVHKFQNKSIFAIVKKGKVLGAKGYYAHKESIMSVLNKLCQKGKIKEDEVLFAKQQLYWA